MRTPSDKAVKALAADAHQRSLDARRRIQRALRDLRKQNQTININTIAKRAKVSRKTIYSHPDLRDQIRAHAQIRPAPEQTDPIETSIVTALRSQLSAKEAEIKQLRAEIRTQKATIATLYGALESQSNIGHTTN